MMLRVSVLMLFLSFAYSANFGISRYHEEVGIPLARRLRDHEQKVLRTGKIAGGDYTDISEIPHQAGIIIELLPCFLSFCGGTLISSTRVLTAAHCYIEGATNLVTLGSNFVFYGGVRANVTKFIIHPGYSSTESTYKDDLALLHITPVSFSDFVQPVALPSPEDVSKNFACYWGRVSGYGLTPDTIVSLSQVLRSVTVQVLSPEQCGAFFGPIGSRDETICTSGEGGVGICASDSGGPLTVFHNDQRVLIGIISFGAGCGLPFPSGYVRVSQYLDWILEN